MTRATSQWCHVVSVVRSVRTFSDLPDAPDCACAYSPVQRPVVSKASWQLLSNNSFLKDLFNWTHRPVDDGGDCAHECHIKD